jgi:hypothetical protein
MFILDERCTILPLKTVLPSTKNVGFLMSKLVYYLETMDYQWITLGHTVAYNLLYINYEELP